MEWHNPGRRDGGPGAAEELTRAYAPALGWVERLGQQMGGGGEVEGLLMRVMCG